MRMAELRDLYRTVYGAVRKPFRRYVPGGRGQAGTWHDNWSDHEKVTMRKLNALRRERDDGK